MSEEPAIIGKTDEGHAIYDLSKWVLADAVERGMPNEVLNVLRWAQPYVPWSDGRSFLAQYPIWVGPNKEWPVLKSPPVVTHDRLYDTGYLPEWIAKSLFRTLHTKRLVEHEGQWYYLITRRWADKFYRRMLAFYGDTSGTRHGKALWQFRAWKDYLGLRAIALWPIRSFTDPWGDHRKRAPRIGPWLNRA